MPQDMAKADPVPGVLPVGIGQEEVAILRIANATL